MCKTKLTWMQLRSSGRIARAISVLAAILFATPPLGKSVALTKLCSRRYRTQKADALPLTSFYDTPVPLPPGAAGSLINSEPFEEYPEYRQKSARSGFYIILGPQADGTWPHRASFLFLSERRLPVVGR